MLQEQAGEDGTILDLILPPNFPSEELLQQSQDFYYTELVPGKEYQTKLPSKAQVNESDLEIDRRACTGLSQADLSLL